MSASLRERLKGAGRCYKSPAPIKRQCITPVSSAIRESSDIPRIPSLPLTPIAKQLSVKTVSPISSKECDTSQVIQDVKFKSGVSISKCESETIGHEAVLNLNDCKDMPAPINSSEVGVDNNENNLQTIPNIVELQQVPKTKSNIPATTGNTSDSTSVDMIATLKKEKAMLIQSIAQKEEKLRKLNMVKMYRSKVGH